MRPDPGRARAWLESELARPEYHRQSLFDRFLGWLDGLWARLGAAASDAGGLSTVVAVILALLVAVLVLLVLSRVRRTTRAPVEPRPVLVGEPTSADEHLCRAEAALAAGRWSDSVVEAVRALARRMVDRGVVEEAPGSTAHEIALAVAGAFPQARTRLVDAAGVFDAVQYGGAEASHDDAAAVLALHDELRSAAPAAAAPRRRLVQSVPR